ncbi:GW dipeptide domain-containing protein, partial [Paenibacillus sp. TAF58]
LEVGTALQDNDHTGVNQLADGRLRNGDYKIIAELTTVYDRSYLVQTADGDKWVRGVGTIISDADETMDLKVETPLLSDVWSTDNQELAVLKGVSVTAFETIQDPFNGTWYHVRTSQGTTGWVNKRRAEPENAIPVKWKIRLMGEKVPFRYPGVNFAEQKPSLLAQTVTALAYWDEPSGNKWVKIQTAEGDVWVTISYKDRIQVPEATLQIEYNERNLGYATIIPQGQVLTLFG